jgi:hypothetical protein
MHALSPVFTDDSRDSIGHIARNYPPGKPFLFQGIAVSISGKYAENDPLQ